MVEKLFWLIKGYVIVELCGLYPERFFNLCKSRNIAITDIFTVDTSCFCRISLKDYKNLRPVAKKAHCIPKIRKREGMPFLVKRAAGRKGFLIGFCLSLILAWQCSLRVWNIEVYGGFLHTKEQILDYLEEEGISAGIRSNDIDCFELEKQMRLHYPDIGWVSAEIKGTNLYINLNESVMPKEADVPEGEYHIVAAQDGIVEKISVKAGVPKVKKGDTVQKGDILISGVVPIIGDNELLLRKQPLAAQGEVLLRSSFSYSADASMYYTKKTVTKQKRGIQIMVLGKKLFSYIPRYSIGKYDIMTVDVKPVMFEEFSFPVRIREYRLLAYEETRERYTEEEAVSRAEEKLSAFLADWEKQKVEILSKEVSFEVFQNVCQARGTITARGNFISYQEISEEEWRTEYEHSGDNP
ncbi:MAG: sporulation protein YqfD [Lachnospiraceae bacterium]